MRRDTAERVLIIGLLTLTLLICLRAGCQPRDKDGLTPAQRQAADGAWNGRGNISRAYLSDVCGQWRAREGNTRRTLAWCEAAKRIQEREDVAWWDKLSAAEKRQWER